MYKNFTTFTCEMNFFFSPRKIIEFILYNVINDEQPLLSFLFHFLSIFTRLNTHKSSSNLTYESSLIHRKTKEKKTDNEIIISHGSQQFLAINTRILRQTRDYIFIERRKIKARIHCCLRVSKIIYFFVSSSSFIFNSCEAQKWKTKKKFLVVFKDNFLIDFPLTEFPLLARVFHVIW